MKWLDKIGPAENIQQDPNHRFVTERELLDIRSTINHMALLQSKWNTLAKEHRVDYLVKDDRERQITDSSGKVVHGAVYFEIR